MLNNVSSSGSFSERLKDVEGANLLHSPLGFTNTICCNSGSKPQSPSPSCCIRSLCCSFRCVWASDSSSTLVCTALIVVLSGFFQFSWWASAADVDQLRFWAPVADATSIDEVGQCFGSTQTRRIHLVWFPVVTVQFVLMAATVFLLWATTMTNPGILPKQSLSANATAPATDMTQVQYVNGIQVYRPFCGTCNIVRPVRASHCATCNNCVERFDHHCGMIGACIGRRNFHYFFAFLCAITVLCAWTASCGVVLAIPTLHCSMVRFGLLVVVIFFAGLLCVQLSAMTMYFIPLVGRNITKREDIKLDRLYHQPPYPGAHPFDKGSWNKNCAAMLCEPFDAVEFV